MAGVIADDQTFIDDQTSYVYPFSWAELARTLLVGECVGLLTALLAHPIQRFIIEPFFCRSGHTMSICTTQSQLGFGIALVVLSVAALLVLASLQVYQPLLIVLATVGALWGVDRHLSVLANDHQAIFYVFVGLLFAAAYGLFYLLFRLRTLIVSVIIVLIAIVLLRLQF
jgi:hypothetical protein